ncbi:MAG: neutral/alkaline non-lysosomal ceramidase N-terminal domain-containing protein [Sporocytophaga sp.]|uniref:neutral/alkaline non-lysosomal ceramidase N-terminal domain-containing protein n=1 Tax=Sporocytophaga sp. TaxID=2231183 RepID=UPI001B05B49E|nr:neutral/alkaline non-lysosomal ceramidase N-terminal domain-containing protein [Sporocytophaga sp.]MBO9698722.1 neutral/alkaline non-lysosomal ceramidase N-terminal domain-containing protein [Sporocytophaga sp.]
MKKSSFLKKTSKIFLIIIICLFILAIALIDTVDKTPLKETAYYHQMMEQVDTLHYEEDSLFITGGWAKANITPLQPLQIASYGLRRDFDGVHDSLFVRSFVFKSKEKKCALITMDLLIVPPSVAAKALPLLQKEGFGRDEVYFSATHSHNAAGGWAEGAGGRFLAGTFEEDYVQFIADKIVTSVKNAQKTAAPIELGFGKIDASKQVANRLIDGGKIDPYLRILKLKKNNGENAMILSYSAHPTCLAKKINYISCDYPGFLVDSLERRKETDFAAFFAGAVGSMKPGETGTADFEKASTIADSLEEKVIAISDSIHLEKPNELLSDFIPLYARSAHLRLTEDFRIRPWVFNWLLGKQSPGISVFKIGNNVMIGTPCDFSGELMTPLDSLAKTKNLNLQITSFNGAYLGYITPDRYYNLVKNETREMNWFGPFNGAYFSELIAKILRKLE